MQQMACANQRSLCAGGHCLQGDVQAELSHDLQVDDEVEHGAEDQHTQWHTY